MDTLALLNRWQHDFPLVPAPFAAIAAVLGNTESEVIAACRNAQAGGVISRIGGVWAAGAGGAAMLCALAVPASRLEAVAAQVDAVPGVNHNYEREHRYNLWFVITGGDAATLHARLDALERDTALRALRLPMQRVYRIDLGFDLERGQAARRAAACGTGVQRVAPLDAPLAALVEGGLPLIERPYAAWAERLGLAEAAVLQTLRRWLAQGTLRRFGVVVRHHELGFDQNAMTVFDVPDAQVDACGAALARQPGVTLCYRRTRAEGWPFNLYCMVHGRERAAVRQLIDAATHAAGLQHRPHEVLFSLRRFKQQGASYFRASTKEAEHAGA
ncbi:MAG TPA: Lrp/AsnC family transcriptional regulator [Piscinibacter sp.]|nr:Lrp/AsnC family transcriptional regulator [Piscinibacter sp.]HOY35023.1 Lrp/AsnC family transcriptional regulator [Piscinibacter sp.]HPG80030.1 Lrp/AsnC family transcriptional regulator [Piscinibacter sp.]HPM67997.1 Lrp/AsnC family transcriptional regulator [Piscinibacter sp.]